MRPNEFWPLSIAPNKFFLDGEGREPAERGAERAAGGDAGRGVEKEGRAAAGGDDAAAAPADVATNGEFGRDPSIYALGSTPAASNRWRLLGVDPVPPGEDDAAAEAAAAGDRNMVMPKGVSGVEGAEEAAAVAAVRSGDETAPSCSANLRLTGSLLLAAAAAAASICACAAACNRRPCLLRGGDAVGTSGVTGESGGVIVEANSARM